MRDPENAPPSDDPAAAPTAAEAAGVAPLRPPFASEKSRVMTAWLWRSYLKRHFGVISVAMVFMAIEGGMLGALSYLIKPMFDEVMLAGNRESLIWVAMAVFAVFALRASASFLHQTIMAWVSLRVSKALQSDLVRHMVTLDGAFFQKNPPGALIERTRADSAAVSSVWGTVFAALGRDVIGLVSLMSVAIWVDWRWTLIAVMGLPLLILPLTALQRLVRRSSKSARAAAADISNQLDEIFHGVNTIKLAGIENRETTRFSAQLRGFNRVELKSKAGQFAVPAIIDILAGLGFFAVLTYGGLQIIEGTRTVGEFMAFFTAMALVFEPLRRLGNLSGAWQAALASIERIYAVFEEKPTITAPAVAKPLPHPGPYDVTFENVSFSYGTQPILHNVSFTAPAGKTTAIVGASGAGKSTLFGLLPRLIDPSSGDILVGGVSTRALDLARLRGAMSSVTQDAQMFDETLIDNIILDQSPDQTVIDAAIKAAHVDVFLPQLALGVKTKAGPRGSALSGGQRQRVAIARAVLRDTPILLLDEATSALDAASELAVQTALEQLAKGRTTLVIAHRLSTIKNAHQIIVMDQGRVVDQGDHDTLIARGGTYAELYRMQFNG